MSPRRIGSVLLLIGLFSARPSAADASSPEERASTLFQTGSDAYARGEYRAAAQAFEAAFRLVPRGQAAYNAGIAWQEAKARDRAANALARALAAGDLDATQAQDAKQRLDALAPGLGRLKVRAAAGRVSVGPVEGEPAPLEVYLEPGSQRVQLERPDGSTLQHSVSIDAGRTSELDFAETTPPRREPSPAPRPVEPETSGTSQRTWGFVAVGTGVVASGAAVWLGVRALHARDDYENGGSTDQALRDRAASLRLWTNVAWGTAIVAGGVGLTLILTSKPGTSQPSSALELGPGAVRVTTRF